MFSDSGANGAGNNVLIPAISVSVALLVLTFILFTPISVSGDAGICLPSPNEWTLPAFTGWFVDALVIFITVFVCANLNRKYNLISSADSFLPAMLMLMLCSNPITSISLSTTNLLLGINILCIYFLFDTFEKTNASQQFFSIATFISLGSLFQYAFIMMVPVYILGGVLMKSLRLREIIAFIFGLVAPFWIILGLGLVQLQDFRFPEKLTTIATANVNTDLFVMILVSGIVAILSVILSLYNGIKLYSRNSRIRSMHLTFNILGIAALACMLIDFYNFLSYFGLLCLWFSIQIANLFSLYRILKPKLWFGIISAMVIIAYAFIV